MLSSQHTTRQPSHSPGPRKRSTSGRSKIAVSLNSDSGYLGRLIEDTPELDWLMLTKRPENYEKLAPWPLDRIPSNVWLGVTCEDQLHYERRWAILSRARIRATVKFISYEPALGPLSKLQLQWGGRVPDWIICGGESGTDARRIKPAWVRAVRDECAAGTAVSVWEKGLAILRERSTDRYLVKS
ncbi:MAG: DUF5131 family protein [Alphaproteobacteria bacterium]|nr:MAG: DUF5131 family protein [Alphaproteobacteria bacterium]